MSTANKLIYLNETKKKIKNTINYAGAGIASDTFRSYPETLYNTYADILNGGTEDLFNGIPHVTGSGTSLSLNNSAECKMQLNLRGNTNQESTTGKNLLNIPDETQTSNGITFVVQNGEITINGTATATAFYQGTINLPVSAEKYSWSANNPTTNTNVIMRFFGNATNYMQGYFTTANKTQTETFESAVTLEYLIIRIASGTTLTNFKIKPQFEKGNPTSYEPYTNGASPNPDYPQDIHVVSGDNSIEVCGKNRLDMSSISVDANCTINNGVITSNSLNAWNAFGIKINDIYLEPNVDYYVTFKARRIAGEGTFNYGGRITDGTNWSTQFSVTKPVITNEFQTFCFKINTTIENFVGIKMYFQNSDKVSTLEVKEIIVSKIQDDTYEPYTGASYPINLPVENLIQLNEINLSANTITDLQLGANLPVGTYNFNGENITGDGRFNLYGTDLNDTQENLLINELTKNIGGGYSFTTTKIYKAVKIYTNVALSGKVQLEKGNKKNSFTPYGTTPIWLGKIGTYQDKIDKSTGKNLFDKSTITSGKYIDNTGTEVANIGFSSSDYIDVSNYSNITLSGNTYIQAGFGAKTSFYDNNKTFISYENIVIGSNTYLVPSNAKYFRTSIRTSTTESDLDKIMLNEGTTALPYEPYGTSWYLKKEIGKVVLNGSSSEGWALASTYTNNTRYNSANVKLGKNTPLISNYFLEGTGGTDTTNIDTNGTTGQVMITIPNTLGNTLENFKAWLSTHNTEVYYALATPTYTKITDTTLANQLEDIYKAKSYNNQTNISQTSADLPFAIDATAALDYDHIS